ncbi:efflux RND transporter periplasmic adaptor subunit [uncultured Shewanella sp.]|uniref:efflux RND transporter periplasmic adaptor subunit n=1 Tax=uncultured Shewanella sp. TaxID=173975 RepID=UPI00263A0A53|nr:efflux RND transporter periplasmic adaptor subunit [uncultured Shewanella sp.]
MTYPLSTLQLKPLLVFLSSLFITILLFSNISVASGDDHGNHDALEETRGPHGGKLLQKGEFEIEITLYEAGIPPEMRIYAYQSGKAIAPNKVDLDVQLTRLGGEQNKLTFTPEKDYLVSQQVVTEPHSFVVNVNATYQQQKLQWQYESFEGRTQISKRLLALSDVQTQKSGPHQLIFTEQLFGIVEPITHHIFNVNAPYTGIVDKLYVGIGDQVKKGQIIANIINSDTLSLYHVKSPANGQVTEQFLNKGDHTGNGPIVRISDLSSVWIDLSAFPSQMDKLKVGLPVKVLDDHNEDKINTEISYISPLMTGGHIARARAVIDNTQGHWRPGMHIKAEIETATKTVPIAVNVQAIQTFRGHPVVFAKYGNIFEVRMLKLGESDGQYVEVLDGLDAGVEYVSKNSFLIKADIQKNAAKHQH